MLLLEVDPGRLPSAKQLRELCRMHAAEGPTRQRIALSLLLENGAYELETVSQLELVT